MMERFHTFFVKSHSANNVADGSEKQDDAHVVPSLQLVENTRPCFTETLKERIGNHVGMWASFTATSVESMQDYALHSRMDAL